MGWMFSTLSRPALSLLPPETSHRLALAALRPRPAWRLAGRLLAARDASLEIDRAGLHLANPVGLSAGFDKDCRVLGSLLDLGFGFAVGGTVTLGPRSGNLRPRLLRNTKDRALINAMGFPGRGVDYAASRLQRLSERDRQRVFVSVSGEDDEQIGECYMRVEPLAAAVEINISSPNTAGLDVFHEPERLRSLVAGLPRQHGRPCFVKLPRPADRGALVELASAAVDGGADGVVVANTLPVENSRLAVGRGGLSGRPLLESTLESVAAVREALPAEKPVIACGGISSAADVTRAMDAGAAVVQLYSAFVYEGPGLPGAIGRALARRAAR